MEEHRPWGYYEVLADAADHKVKRITVHPGKRLSLQRHSRRSEHWHFVAGDAVVTARALQRLLARARERGIRTWEELEGLAR